MRGLNSVGVLPFFGAISCVSGGSWFGAPFSYAPGSFTVDELLGDVVPPGNITVSGLQTIPDTCLGYALLNLSDVALSAVIGYQLLQYALGNLPFDKIWARTLNDLILLPFFLADTSSYFSLDATTVSNIVQNNPGLAQTNFYTIRDGQPYIFIGGTQIYPTSALPQRGDLVRAPHPAPRSKASVSAVTLPGQIYRHFEYSPAYVGTSQFYSGAGCGGADFGGGYVQSFGFDSAAPSAPAQKNIVSVPTPAFQFLLSDAIGSSSAAIAAYLDEFGWDPVFPEFSYWPLANIGKEKACTYSFGDGGILENTGIIPLLRRQYGVIFAFVNTPYPFGSTDDGCYEGVDGQITRLFGHIPKNDFGNSQNTQIFPKNQFDIVLKGLKQSKAAGGTVFAAGKFTIQTPNNFALPAYPGNGEVLIFWMYNDLNQSWKNQLTPAVRALLSSTKPSNYMANFPNYATVFQNEDEVLLLSAQQVNLLADMWSYNIINGFTGKGQAFGVTVPTPQ